jgi:hypothetical protein
MLAASNTPRSTALGFNMLAQAMLFGVVRHAIQGGIS